MVGGPVVSFDTVGVLPKVGSFVITSLPGVGLGVVGSDSTGLGVVGSGSLVTMNVGTGVDGGSVTSMHTLTAMHSSPKSNSIAQHSSSLSKYVIPSILSGISYPLVHVFVPPSDSSMYHLRSGQGDGAGLATPTLGEGVVGSGSGTGTGTGIGGSGQGSLQTSSYLQSPIFPFTIKFDSQHVFILTNCSATLSGSSYPLVHFFVSSLKYHLRSGHDVGADDGSEVIIISTGSGVGSGVGSSVGSGVGSGFGAGSGTGGSGTGGAGGGIGLSLEVSLGESLGASLIKSLGASLGESLGASLGVLLNVGLYVLYQSNKERCML